MKFIKRQKKKINFFKIYVDMNQNSFAPCINELINLYVKIAQSRSAFCSINYSDLSEMQVDDLSQRISGLSLGRIENIRAFNSDESISFGVNFLKIIDDRFCELRVVFPATENFFNIFKDFSRALIEFGDVYYGYGRIVDESIDPNSETKIKKSIFGISVTVEPMSKTWLYEPKFKPNLLKGIYSINLIKSDLLHDKFISVCVNKNPDCIQKINHEFAILQCTPEALNEISKTHPDISKYVSE